MKQVIRQGQTIKVDGREYYRVRMQCPVCLERGLNPEMKYWRHGDCGGDLYVGGNAYFFCEKCEDTGHVMEYGYRCSLHDPSNKGEYVKVNDPKYIGAAVAAGAGAMTGSEDAGLEFLEEFIINLRRR